MVLNELYALQPTETKVQQKKKKKNNNKKKSFAPSQPHQAYIQVVQNTRT